MSADNKAKKPYRVLIKDPLAGIREDYWELTEEQVKGAIDADGVVYATCYYDEGKPKYVFVPPAVWEKWDEVQKIFHNPKLSTEEQAAAIRKLMKE